MHEHRCYIRERYLFFSHGWFTRRRNMFAEMTIKYKNSCTGFTQSFNQNRVSNRERTPLFIVLSARQTLSQEFILKLVGFVTCSVRHRSEVQRTLFIKSKPHWHTRTLTDTHRESHIHTWHPTCAWASPPININTLVRHTALDSVGF